MNVVTVGRRFQVVIPKAIREQLQLQPGDKLEVNVEKDRIVMRILHKSKPKRDLPFKEEAQKQDCNRNYRPF